MIQTWEQYQFVHQALSRYGRILAGENVTTPSTAGSIRSPPDRSAKHELSLPSTFRHRRSQSDTTMPSPKEMKLNFKYPVVEPTGSDTFSGKTGFSKSNSVAPSFSPISQSSNESLSGSATIKPSVSPTIHSPLARMCLQAKDLNVTQPSSEKQILFDKKLKPTDESAAMKTKLLCEINGSPKNGLTFQLPMSRASPKPTSATSNNAPLFSFDRPAPVSNGSPIEPTSGDRKCSGNDESNSNQNRFFFPGSAER